MKFNSVQELDKLDYFKKDENNRLILADGVFDQGIIDFHAHLGFSYFFGKKIDLECPCRMQHFFPEEDNPIDLDIYSAYDFTPENRDICQKETVRQGLNNNGFARTHTIPNILEEMDRMKVSQSVILAVELALASKNTEHILKHVKNVDRLIPFMSLHPFWMGKREKIVRHIADGARGIKLHPPVQMVKPSSKTYYPIYELAREYNLPVFFHSGHSPLSPDFERKYVNINDYETAIKAFPDVTMIMGHSSIDNFREAAQLGRKYENVYLETSGQPPAAINEIVNIMGSEKVLFGSDWPFYPIAFPLVKVLIATEKTPLVRERHLKTNAERLLAKFPSRTSEQGVSLMKYIFASLMGK
jgi:predicted TIM-barrel fold metal-dependent hydrolase